MGGESIYKGEYREAISAVLLRTQIGCTVQT
ncbi:MAG: hypothetical protein GAK45_01949 [Pseudomonas citronellolis]|nr:MAG: hypothetical protein GAK45_01949 [Pseudomonas citronellolis]